MKPLHPANAASRKVVGDVGGVGVGGVGVGGCGCGRCGWCGIDINKDLEWLMLFQAMYIQNWYICFNLP